MYVYFNFSVKKVCVIKSIRIPKRKKGNVKNMEKRIAKGFPIPCYAGSVISCILKTLYPSCGGKRPISLIGVFSC